ncbi:hypothetical protein [Parvibaculum sp.]|uniref:hypothetical protein n=1 Tax=Parvibaculum sp. TaxID=2024848 RepID=UPI001E053772|nr:hypothetical protein [Parvibaculum sp.]MBX3490843.1 hypothetical protein [Parvibaculum sp.]
MTDTLAKTAAAAVMANLRDRGEFCQILALEKSNHPAWIAADLQAVMEERLAQIIGGVFASSPAPDHEQIAGIKALAEAALKVAPGKWESEGTVNEDGYGGFISYSVSLPDGRAVCDTLNSGLIEIEQQIDEDGQHDFDRAGLACTEFIAAANPAAVLGLIARIEAEKRRADEAKALAGLLMEHLLRDLDFAAMERFILGAEEEWRRKWLTEAIDVLSGMNDDEINEELLPQLRALVTKEAGSDSKDAPLCSDCPPVGYPTDETRCGECPRRSTP